ncbi:tyrosine-type recombinase/integrase [Mobiluncus curtisii]|uniref:tyrosine-type recombinase/integrase n=1 Tax=Mobiluncus curtisii TaxID=2051 RepID=UPI0009D75362|nr:tyrosine-type recombinase/integrase [Mobiluncus curtisii]NMW47782.1 tyrosine-type recombinase/integrase [Mobiluncus curtisii]
MTGLRPRRTPLIPFVDSLDWYNTAQGRTIHDRRHAAICIWLAAGIDLATVRAWAGHADLTTTSRYTHWLGTKADQTSLATLNKVIQNTTSPSPVTSISAVNGGTHGVREKRNTTM